MQWVADNMQYPAVASIAGAYSAALKQASFMTDNQACVFTFPVCGLPTDSKASVQAMQWVADNVQYPAVVSASIAGANSAALNKAAQSLVNDFGITVVAAEGE